MVKGLKTFSLDIAIIKLLNEEPNQSGIINRLLHNYFEEKGTKEIKQKAKEEKQKAKEIEAEVEAVLG